MRRLPSTILAASLLAGTLTYHVGGFHACWQPLEHETIDLTLFGDQYPNFNTGKILLYLEALAGLKISVPDQKLTIAPALPESWPWMELRLPIANQ